MYRSRPNEYKRVLYKKDLLAVLSRIPFRGFGIRLRESSPQDLRMETPMNTLPKFVHLKDSGVYLAAPEAENRPRLDGRISRQYAAALI